MLTQNIEPHQLDYDWRFDSVSRNFLGACTSGNERVLLLGCPSLMNVLESKNASGLLVERNPVHLPTKRVAVEYQDLRYFQPTSMTGGKYDAAFLDAPWYPHDLCIWVNVALNLVRVGASIFFVLWPEGTRPSAPIEHKELKSSLRAIGDLSEVGIVSYEMPTFERISTRNFSESFPRRVGHLFKFVKQSEREKLHCGSAMVGIGRWTRFTFGQTQLAIKTDSNVGRVSNLDGFIQTPFVLPSTSRRDPALGFVNIWTSRNIVARLKNPESIVSGIQNASEEIFYFLSKYFEIGIDPGNNLGGVQWQHQA